MLVELTELERASALAPVASTPPMPSAAAPLSFWAGVDDAIRTLFAGFGPAFQAGLTRGESLGVEPVAVMLAEGTVVVELDIEANEPDPAQRDLFCHVETTTATQLEAQPVWLQAGHDGPILAEQALDEFGDAFFSNLQPGAYTLWLRLGSQVYTIQAIALP
jgi:hypothetical protein